MKNFLIMALAMLLALPAAAQNSSENIPVINVTGKVEMKIVPDRIYIKIVVKDNDIKGLNVNSIQARMIAALKRLGIDTEKDLKVNDMENALRRRNQAQTTKSYQLVVENAAQMASVYNALSELGISNIKVTKVDNSKMETYRAEARQQAIRQAKQNAEALAAAIGQSIGPAVHIYDHGGGVSDLSTVVAYGRAANKSMVAEETAFDSVDDGANVEFREITISHSVNVRFLLNEQ